MSRRLLGPVVLLGVILLYGGYGAHWSWTGINGHTATLWDWLHLLALPLAAVVLALWLRHRPEVGIAGRAAVAGLGLGFAALVLAGYAIPWSWTGFTGNTLWDWLNLALLPLAVTLIPVLIELRPAWERRHVAGLAAGLAGFVALVAAGYLIPWPWTGFTGNTAWDWLHLLLLPLLVPVVIVPVLRSVALTRLGVEPTAVDPETPPVAEIPPAGQDPEPI